MKPVSFLFLDLETTGLAHRACAIIQVGMVACDDELQPIADFSDYVTPPPEELWEPYALGMHRESGLLDEARTAGMPRFDVEAAAIAWMSSLVFATSSDTKPVMCGNSLRLDRNFLDVHMSALHRCFHYRTLDVSAIRCAVVGLGLEDYQAPPDVKAHEAIADCLASIKQLRFYRDRYFRAIP